MAWLVMRLASINIRSLYKHDIKAMGRKLLGSLVEFFLFMNQDRGCSLPVGRDVLGFKAMGEHVRQDFAFWIEEAKVVIFQAVLARCRVGEGA